VAFQVIRAIKARNGRFLTRVDKATSFVAEDGVWAELSEREAIEKVRLCCGDFLSLYVSCSRFYSFYWIVVQTGTSTAS
jgi:hypothetical protein